MSNRLFLNNELNDHFVKKAVEVIHNNMQNLDFDKESFAMEMHVSGSLLYKKIKALTGLSPIEFIKSIRLNRALELLQSHKYTITEVSELCGYSVSVTLVRCLKSTLASLLQRSNLLLFPVFYRL